MSDQVKDIEKKILSSKLPNDTKEIFRLLMTVLTTITASKDKKIEQMDGKITILENRINHLETMIDHESQYERRDTVVFSGEKVPNDSPGENCKSIIQRLLNQDLELGNVNVNDISTAHRIGRQQEGQVKRNIIVKLCRKDLVSDIYKRCKTINPKFFVNDSLTPLRSKIAYALRQLKCRYPEKIQSTRSFNGIPRAFIKPTSRPTRSSGTQQNQQISISTRMELEVFARDHLDTTLTECQLTQIF